MGIKDEDKKLLFQPFFKSKNKESTDKNSNSHGLGLNICKRIAQKLGGDLIHNEEM
jgi:signal transduction histidine kinase